MMALSFCHHIGKFHGLGPLPVRDQWEWNDEEELAE
jgi:hypothetical protein